MQKKSILLVIQNWSNPFVIFSLIPSISSWIISLTKLLSKIKQKRILVCDIRSLLLVFIPSFFTGKKIYFYLIGDLFIPKIVFKFLLLFVHKTLVISPELSLKYSIEKYEILRNGVYDPYNLVNTTKSTDNKIRLAYVGSITPHKGLHNSIKNLLKSEIDFNYEIFGEVVSEKDLWYSDYINELIKNDNRFILKGFQTDIPKKLRQFNFLLFPSVTYDSIKWNNKKYNFSSSEGSPTVIIEAVFSACKVLTSEVMGIKDLQKNLPNIYIVDFKKDNIANKLLELNKMKNKTVSSEMIDKFDQKMIYYKFFNNL